MTFDTIKKLSDRELSDIARNGNFIAGFESNPEAIEDMRSLARAEMKRRARNQARQSS